MKNVLVIAPYPYLPYFSGGQKFIARFLHYLGKQVKLDVISVADGNDLSLATTYRVIPLLKKSFFRYADFSLVRKISRIVNENGYDTIIWEHPYFAWLAAAVKKRTGVRTILHTHNIEFSRFRSLGKWWWPFLKIYEKYFFKKADAIFFISPDDRNFAIRNWHIREEKCITLPFGVETDHTPADKPESRKSLVQRHRIPEGHTIILFNGLLRYPPNLEALKVILDQVNPLLMEQKDFAYTIIICGKDLPAGLDKLTAYRDKNICYAGFVDDIDIYFKGADLFLNPVQSGGGIKTKMVEAIAYGTTVIATQTGATGMDPLVCGKKLLILPDDEWRGFAETIIQQSLTKPATPEIFYKTYYWENVIQKMLIDLQN